MKCIILYCVLMGLVACEDKSKHLQYERQFRDQRQEIAIEKQRADNYKKWLYVSLFGAFSLYIVGVGIGSYTKRLSRKDE